MEVKQMDKVNDLFYGSDDSYYIQEYGRRLELYEKFTKKVQDLIYELLKQTEIEIENISARVKTLESFEGKLKRKNYKDPFKEMTDLSGVRIILYYKEDIDKLGEIIKREFDVDWDNSVDKSKLIDSDKIGYLSTHYIVSVAKDRLKLTEWRMFEGLKCEIQIRTILQHAWAAIDHKIRYKPSNKVPKKLERKLFLLAGLLELADDEFSFIKTLTTEMEGYYSMMIKANNLKNVDINLTSLEVFLDLTEKKYNFMDIIEKAGFVNYEKSSELSSAEKEKIKSASKTLLLEVLNALEFDSIEDLQKILDDSISWFEEKFTALKALFKNFDVYITVYDVVMAIVLFSINEERYIENGFDILSYKRKLIELKDKLARKLPFFRGNELSHKEASSDELSSLEEVLGEQIKELTPSQLVELRKAIAYDVPAFFDDNEKLKGILDDAAKEKMKKLITDMKNKSFPVPSISVENEWKEDEK